MLGGGCFHECSQILRKLEKVTQAAELLSVLLLGEGGKMLSAFWREGAKATKPGRASEAAGAPRVPDGQVGPSPS